MVLCCGRRSIATSDDAPTSPPRRSSSFDSIRASFLASEGPEESEWQVGGRYKVQLNIPIHATPELVEETGTLKPKDTVLLLSVQTKACTEVGLVVPGGVRREQGVKPGWIVLQNAMSEKGSLVRKRLEGSWEMKARYRVNNPATVRQEASLSSPEVGEVEPGEEVVVLDLGLDQGSGSEVGEARLRALISGTGTGLLGWISPETTAGDRLLDPVNLLGMEVVKLHRQSLVATGGSSPTRVSISPTSPVAGDERGRPRRSCLPGATVPWEVGGKYRVLEKLAVLEKPELSSREIGKVSPGSLATLAHIHNVECAHLGWCPSAFVTVEEGPEEGTKGWVRCAAKDGHDLIDTRDQLESEKILHMIRLSQAAPQATQQEETRDQIDRIDEENPDLAQGQASWQNTSETTSDSRHSRASSSDVGALKRRQKGAEGDEEASSEEEKEGKAAKGKAGADVLEQLESLETAREDRPIIAEGSMEGTEKSICGCNCGTGGGFRPKR